MSTTPSTCRCISSYRDGKYINDVRAKASAPFLKASCRSFPARSRCSRTGPITSPRSSRKCGSRNISKCAAPIPARGAGSARCPRFWVGLLYDQAALDAAWDLVKDWTAEERQALRDAVPCQGLERDDPWTERSGYGPRRAEARRAPGSKPAAQHGCKGKTEAAFLDVLDEIVATGKTARRKSAGALQRPAGTATSTACSAISRIESRALAPQW